jgi:hypothetical protein
MMSPRRPSRIPRPIFGKLHLGWQRVLAALRGAGLARDLDMQNIREWLGVAAEHAPTQPRVWALLDAYYRGDDDLAAGGRRRLEDRFVSHREGDAGAARQIVARISAVLPELGPMVFADERRAGVSRLVLRVVGAHVEVRSEELEDELGGSSRTVTVDGLIAAANALLADHGAAFRFLPIDASNEAAAYVGVDRSGAQMLDAIGMWAPPLGELTEFARWTEAARTTPPPAADSDSVRPAHNAA